MTTPSSPRRFSLAAGGAALLVSNAAYMVLSFLSGVIIARWLGADGRGIVALFFTTPGQLLIIANLGVPNAVSYFVARQEDATAQVLRSALGFGLAASLLSVGVLFALSPPTSAYWSGIPLWAMMTMPVMTCALVWLNVARRVHASRFHVHYVGISQVVEGGARLLVNLVLVVGLGLGVTGGLVAAVAEILLAAAAALYLVSRYARVRIGWDWSWVRQFLGYGIQSWLFLMLANTNLNVGIYALKYFAGSEDFVAVGIFAVAKGMTLMLQTVPDAWVSLLLPVVAKSDHTRQNPRTLQICRNGLLALAVMGSALAAAAPVLVPLVYGEEFAPAVVATWLMVPGLLLLHVYRTLAIDFAARRRQVVPMVAAASGLAVNLVLCAVLIPRMPWAGGLAAASIALTCAAATMAFVMVVMHKARWNTPLRQLLLVTASDIAGYRTKLGAAFRRLRSRGRAGPGSPGQDRQEAGPPAQG